MIQLKDSQGRPIAQIHEDSSNRWVKDEKGNPKGRYDKAGGYTYNEKGEIIGRGDLSSLLIK